MLMANPEVVIIGGKIVDVLDGYYGGNSPGLNVGSATMRIEDTTGTSIVLEWAKP